MPGLIFNTKFKKNDGVILSPEELIDLYFLGVKLIDINGNELSKDTIKKFILSAQQEIEKWLNIKLQRQIIKENKDFYRSDWYEWGYIRTTYPCVKANSLEGFIGETKQITYPKEWLSTRKTNDDELYHRHIYLVPSTNAPTSSVVVYSGMTPHLSLAASPTVPNYWYLEYVTGFCKVPYDLLNLIGMLAAINVFHIMGDLILGAGLSNQSLSIDGLSQSFSTNSGYSSRIKGYIEAINGSSNQQGLKDRVYNYYKGFTVSSF